MIRTLVYSVRFFILMFALTASSVTSATADEAADSVSVYSGHPGTRLALGAGYERYTADWDGRRSTRMEVLQDRFYLQGHYQPVRRLRVGARLGAADLSAPEPEHSFLWTQIDYGFAPFGSIDLSWTPLGAIPGTQGGAIELLFEVSAFAGCTADKMMGYYDSFEMRVDYEAWPEVNAMWEGRLAILVASHNGYFRFRAGPVLLQSGAETRTRFRISWTEGVWNEFTETNYYKTRSEVGVLYGLRFSPGFAMVIDAEGVWTTGGPLFKISLDRILTQ
jgi:hypothetical protein